VDEGELSLADVATVWSKVFEAREADGDKARNELLLRYHEAVYHYLRNELRDPHAADKIFSNFALRVLEVDKFLQRADPERGRFRDYLRTVLRNMIIDHYRAQQRENKKVQGFVEGADQDVADADVSTTLDEDRRFIDWWRQQLINQVWKGLDDVESKTGQPYGAVLRYQVDHPGARSQQIAEDFSAQRGKAFTAAGIRQIIHRAREMFGDLLVQEVARSLRSKGAETVSRERVEHELIELNLLFSYCKAALDRYHEQTQD
jgi:RNA polymerase sigma-70 factor (ECF subfamily)